MLDYVSKIIELQNELSCVSTNEEIEGLCSKTSDKLSALNSNLSTFMRNYGGVGLNTGTSTHISLDKEEDEKEKTSHD